MSEETPSAWGWKKINNLDDALVLHRKVSQFFEDVFVEYFKKGKIEVWEDKEGHLRIKRLSGDEAE